ncbi:TPR repeat family protein [Rickettsia argasii T170-B]|uniref:TPR repeat family protein n=1 Tax=Rickettsia argasii T170-B TaxID=1268837 RepID=A0A0F3R9T1_9RICK|nr:TPR repeat family protein [Rickettsia argasii T170-B]
MKIIEKKFMKNIEKLALIFILPLIFCNVVLAEDYTNSTNTNQQIDQHIQIQDPNILAEEYFNIGRAFYKLGKYEEAMNNFDLAIKYNSSFAEAYNKKEYRIKN